MADATASQAHPPEPRASVPGHRLRWTLTVGAVTTVGIGLIVDPKAVAVGLGLMEGLWLLAALLIARGVWRIWRRPIGTLSIGDAVLAMAALRWWHRRQVRLHGLQGRPSCCLLPSSPATAASSTCNPAKRMTVTKVVTLGSAQL